MARSPAEQIFDSLMISATLPPAEREVHTGQALAAIVGHARQTVPYYRDRLDGVIGADGRVDREAWQALPPLSRRDLQDHKDALASTRCPASHGEIQERSTSGTTGKPVTVLITDRTKLVNQALMARYYCWVGFNPRFALVILQGTRNTSRRYRVPIDETWFPAWLASSDFAPYYRLHQPMSEEEQIAFLTQVGPAYFNTQPSNFRRVLHALRAGAGSMPDLRGLISVGERVTGEDRALAREVAGCEIFDAYTAADVGEMAAQCSHGNLHVNAESVWLETVRADNTPCADGEEGRILVTTMANGAMPLLRYDIGDIGVLGGACGCGLSLPRLTLTVGRERQIFRFSDGTAAVPIFHLENFSAIFPVRQWQLAQTAQEAVELRFSSDAADENLKFDEIVAEIRNTLGRPVDVAFRREEELLGSSGKLEPSIRLV